MSTLPCSFNAKALVGKHDWDTGKTKWNGNLYGPRNGVDKELSFPKHPECERFDQRMFGKPTMSCSANKDVGYVSPAPVKPAGYVPTVLSISVIDSDDSDMEEQSECVDFDSDSWFCTLLRCFTLLPMTY
jgi:hypothetical protein